MAVEKLVKLEACWNHYGSCCLRIIASEKTFAWTKFSHHEFVSLLVEKEGV